MSDPRDIDIYAPHQRRLPGGTILTFSLTTNGKGVWVRYWSADGLRLENEIIVDFDGYALFKQQYPNIDWPDLKPPEPTREEAPVTTAHRPPAGKTTRPNGNTTGRIHFMPAAETDLAVHANPADNLQASHDTDIDGILDTLQTGLDVVGLIPVLGTTTSIVNATISAARGDWTGAGLNLVSAIPFGGWVGGAAKVARHGVDAAEIASKAAVRVAKEAAEKTAKEAAERTAKRAAETASEEMAEQVAKQAKRRKMNDGGKVQGGSSKEKGLCGEWLAKMDMFSEGFEEVVTVQNNSGHGVDLIGRKQSTGEVKVWEVKTTDGPRAGPLKGDQKMLGGEKFTLDRLRRARNGERNYGKSPKAMENAEKALRWIRSTKKAKYEKREVFVDSLDKGCMKHPLRPSQSKPW